MERDVYFCALGRVFGFKPHLGRFFFNDQEQMKSLFSLSREELQLLFPNDASIVNMLSDSSLLEWSYNELKWAREHGIEVILYGDDAYPKLLKQCQDAPPILFYFGKEEPSSLLSNERLISIVGTRLATGYCREVASDIVSGLADYNPVIVSGLAYGIDSAAHKAALDSGVKTIAVLPTGLDRIYPPGHRELAKLISLGGALLTEFPRNTPSSKPFFIRRNRIIAGISQCTIVVETRAVGGSIMTVKYANSYNRDVYALPGRLADANSYGCNYLISRNMASIFIGLSDFVKRMGWDKGGKLKSVEQRNLFSFEESDKSKILVTLKGNSILDVEEICVLSQLKYEVVSQVLLDMELLGEVEFLHGKYRLK